MSVALTDFEAADRQTLERLGTELRTVLEMLQPASGQASCKALREHCQAPAWRSVMASMKVFGQATYDARPDPDMRKVMHDLRGGSLAVLFLRLQALGETLGPTEAAQLCRLVRDHLELIRSCVRDVGDGSVSRPTELYISAPSSSRAGRIPKGPPNHH